MAACAEAAIFQVEPVDKLALHVADPETDDSHSVGEETLTPTTAVSEADSCDSFVEEDAGLGASGAAEEVPQLGPGLYHDDIEDVTPLQHVEVATDDIYDDFEEDDEVAHPEVCTTSSCSTAAPVDCAWPSSFSREETLFVFDWDDTILPSTWVSAQGLRLDDGSELRPDQQECLAEAAALAMETLRLAQRFGTVVIVTNAERGWIELSCQKFLPTLLPFLETVRIVSARTSYDGPGAPTPMDWKVRAFEAEIARFYGLALHDAYKPKNIFSLGDGAHEREALLRTTPALPNCRTKSLKFVDRPDIAQIARQHRLVQGCFETMVHHSGHLDLVTHCD